MKITDSSLQLEASHSQYQHRELSESLRMWIGDRRPDFEGNGRSATTPRPAVEQVDISQAGRAAQSKEASAIEQGIEAAENDPTLRLIRALIAMLTGREVEVFDAGKLKCGNADCAPPAPTDRQGPPPQQPAGFGVEYDRHESYQESERMSFSAAGVVRTADGREISFQVSLSMARSYYEESNLSLRLGDARRQSDPLVLNFAGNAAQLSSQRFAFDLNADGAADEQINFVAGGSGFLAFDRDGSGAIESGAELFGPQTGDGFAELAALDADGNGWIDENDAAYARLAVWTRDAAGQDALVSLAAANVGAISLARVASPFALKDEGNALLGQLRSTGVFLTEDGGAGTVQQIDLTV